MLNFLALDLWFDRNPELFFHDAGAVCRKQAIHSYQPSLVPSGCLLPERLLSKDITQ
jgi:hypothetical protein